MVIEDILEIDQASAILFSNENLFKLIFNEAPFGIAVTDSLTGNVYAVNPMFARIAGRSMEEMKSIDWMSLTYPDDIQKDVENMALLNAGMIDGFRMEKRYLRPDGAIVWIDMKIVPLNAIHLDNPCHLCIIEEISDRKSKEHELIKFSRAVQQSPVSIVITDLQGNIIFGNPKIHEVTGYTPEELTGKNVRIMKSGLTPVETYRNLWETIKSGGEWHGEFLNRKKNGELYWEAASISPIFNSKGVITNFLAIKEDISERKKVLAELEAAKEKAESSDRLKTAFIHNISHEIRTPLTGIMGFTSLLIQPGLSAEEKKEYQSFIQTSSCRLISTVTNYMDIAMIASGNMEVLPGAVNLNQIFKLLFHQFKAACTEKGLELSLQIPEKIETGQFITDAGLLNKAFSHLLDNAIKFTSHGKVSFGYSEKPGSLEFFIEDTGIGIRKEAQEKIFENFVQEEAIHSGEIEGSGLGLSIAKSLVVLLGGNIKVNSETGKGSVFSFTLPFDGSVCNI